jgi:UDP-glucose 4-epimerase
VLSVTRAITEVVTQRLTSDDPINLAFGTRRTLLVVIDDLEEILGRELPREHRLPRPGDVRHSQADDSRLLELLPGITPVPFREGLEATVTWFEGLKTYASA